MGRKKKEKTVTLKDSNVVVKTNVIEDELVKEAILSIKSYCSNVRENGGCERCMFSTVIHMEGTDMNYPFCDLKNKRPQDYKEV